jgi:hypothetical protein
MTTRAEPNRLGAGLPQKFVAFKPHSSARKPHHHETLPCDSDSKCHHCPGLSFIRAFVVSSSQRPIPARQRKYPIDPAGSQRRSQVDAIA